MPASPSPRVSILIPNFNNGRQSSKAGDRDFLGDLFQSLYDTLRDDPTPFEIIVYDDGSTDDSLETARIWAKKKWNAGGDHTGVQKSDIPFLHLIEAPHCGYLSRTANVLCKKARGEILVRLDGDITILTPNWVSRMCEIFDSNPPRLGIVGPKQLTPDLRIHAMGDWLLHPNGYCHVGAGMDRYALTRPIEVDHAMGCFHCMKRATFEDVGGYDETFLRGQTEDLGLRARLKGWNCIAVPDIEFVHYHGLRVSRPTEADSVEGVQKSLKIFRDKWGFCRVSPDLDEVRKRYAGTPLLWNARWFGSPDAAMQAADPPPVQPMRMETSDWGRYATDQAFRARVELRVSAALEVAKQFAPPSRAIHLGCGSGLITHLLATRGLVCTGIDRHAANIDFATRCTANYQYPAPGGAPTFRHHEDCRKIPAGDGQVDFLLVCDVIEKHPNPMALLREIKRVMVPGRPVVIISPRKGMREDAATDGEHRYHWNELATQLRIGAGLKLLNPAGDDPRREMIAIVTRPAPALEVAAPAVAAA